MDRVITPIDSFTVPVGRQQIEFQQIDGESGGMAMLRIRIREGHRFTVFDIDPQTAHRWGQAFLDWSKSQMP